MENYSLNPELYNFLNLSKENNSDDFSKSSEFEDKTSVFSENSISNNTDSLNNIFKNVQDEQGIIGKFWNGFKDLTGLGLGSSDVLNKIEEYEQGKITYSEALEAIESYKNKQDGAVSLISNTATGLATAGFAFATGGAGALLMGAVVGGAANAGLKTLDRATNAVENDALDIKEIAKDGLTGAVDGLVSAATAGFVKAPVMGQTIKQAVKQGVIQGAKSGVVTGAATGAMDYTINTTVDGKDFKLSDLAETTVQNALSGAIFGGLFGGISGGLSQKKLNIENETEFKITHNKNLGAEVDNKLQSERYLNNFNKNNKADMITGQEYNAKIDELSALSQKSEVLERKFDSQLDEAANQVNSVFEGNSDIRKITARSKGQNSIFSKLAKKNIEDGRSLTTLTECYDAIGDAVGLRIQMKNLNNDEATEIVESVFKDFGIDATFDDFVKYIQNGQASSDEMKNVFATVQNEIINALKTKQAQSAVEQLCEGIKTGNIKITELNNYGDDITSYFTNKQIHEILDAYSYAVKNNIVVQDKPFKIVSNSSLMDLSETEVLPGNLVKWVETTQDGVNIEFSQTTKGANKVSGYTSAQMNTKHVLNNGEIANGELQLRGLEVNAFADVEHIPYDIRRGKIFSDDSKYSEIYGLIKTMSEENYSKYNEYLAATYKNLRMKELGLLDVNASLPDISEFIKEGISSKDLRKLDINGLINISKSKSSKGNKIFSFVLNMIK